MTSDTSTLETPAAAEPDWFAQLAECLFAGTQPSTPEPLDLSDIIAALRVSQGTRDALERDHGRLSEQWADRAREAVHGPLDCWLALGRPSVIPGARGEAPGTEPDAADTAREAAAESTGAAA